LHSQVVNTGTTILQTPSFTTIPAGTDVTMVVTNVVGCFDLRFSLVYDQ